MIFEYRPYSGSAEKVDGLDDVRIDQQGAHPHQKRGHYVRGRQKLGDIESPGVGLAEELGHPAAGHFIESTGNMATVQGQQRDKVEHGQGEVQPGEQAHQRPQPGL